MLTGEPPYSADNPLATAMKHLDEPPRHPRGEPCGTRRAGRPDREAAREGSRRPLHERRSTRGRPRARARRAPAPRCGCRATVDRADDPDTGEARTAPTLAAPGEDRAQDPEPGAHCYPWPHVLGAVLLGGLAWAMARDASERGHIGRGAGGGARRRWPVGGGGQGRLGEAGLDLGSQSEGVSDVAATGEVISQTPPAGNQAQRGSDVDVVVGTGPLPQSPPRHRPPHLSSASSSASSTATPTAPASSSPANNEAPKQATEEPQRQAEERAKQRRGRSNKR